MRSLAHLCDDRRAAAQIAAFLKSQKSAFMAHPLSAFSSFQLSIWSCLTSFTCTYCPFVSA